MLATIMTVVLVLATGSSAACDHGSGTLIVRLAGLERTTGFMNVNLFNRAFGFPMEPDRAWKRRRVEVGPDALHVVFACVPTGDYAVSVCHDANANDDCDKNFLGVPTEGVGVSNNVPVILRAPSFDEARFLVADDPTAITIDLDY